MNNNNYVYNILRFLLVVILGTLGIYGIFFISKLAYPFILALLFSYMMNPLVNLLEKKGHLPRVLSVVISLILIISALGGLLTFLIFEIINGSQYLANVVPQYFKTLVLQLETLITSQFVPLYEQLNSQFNQLDPSKQSTITHNIETFGNNIVETGTKLIPAILLSVTAFISNLPTTITALFFSLLGTFFISKDWYKLKQLTSKTMSHRFRGYSVSIFTELRKALFGFIKAQVTLITMTTVMVLLGLIILRVPYAITIALIIGCVDLLPYLGTGFILIPWIVYSFITHNINFGVGLSILYAVVIIQRQIMEPKVLSSNIGLAPLPTLIALFIGFNLYGFLGLIIGPVVLVIIKTLHTAGIFEDLWAFITNKP